MILNQTGLNKYLSTSTQTPQYFQCDIKASGLEESGCTKYSWDSCEHLDMMVKLILVEMLKRVTKKHKHKPEWPPEKLLQGTLFVSVS